MIYFQRLMENVLLWKARQIKMPYRTLEERLEMLEWGVRFSEYVSSDEQQKFMLVYRELYGSTDPNIRNSYIQAQHLNDSVIYITEMIDKEFTRLDYQGTGSVLNDARITIEKKLNVCLVALETLIINDKNLELALESNLLQTIVKLIRGLPLRGPSMTN